MQDAISEIQPKSMFECPICGHTYATLKEAKDCAAMGLWNQTFDTQALLWRWCIFKPQRKYPRIVAIIPKAVKTKYDWGCGQSCYSRAVSIFNAASNDYWNITNSTKVISLSLMEGFDRYRLVPPVQYISGLPDEKADEVMAVLEKAFEVRKKEILHSENPIDAYMLAICAFEFSEFTHPLRLASRKEIPPLIDTSFLPQTRLISGQMLYELEKHIPELAAELEW